MLFQDLPTDVKNIYEAFEVELQSIQQTNHAPLIWAKYSIDAALTTIEKLRCWFSDHPSLLKESEVLFFKLAEFLIVHSLIGHLSQQVVPQGTGSISIPATGKLKWTGPVKGLGQVIRAMVRSRSINHGNVTISEVTRQFEGLFGVDLKNIYRATQEDRITKEPGSFMKHLYEVLLQDYDDMDQNPRRTE